MVFEIMAFYIHIKIIMEVNMTVSQIYTIQEAVSGDTFKGVRFSVVINGSPLDLTGSTIIMEVFTSHNTSTIFSNEVDNAKISVINPPTAGIFELNKQIITLPVGIWNYEIRFTLSDGTKSTYVSGTWTISEN